MALVDLTNVTKLYGDKAAVSDLSLKLEPGEVLCLLGPNGAGKTTTLKMLLGLAKPSSGSVAVSGIDVPSQPDQARRLMAYIPEMVALHERFSAMENLRYFTALVGGSDLSSSHLENCLRRSGLQEEAWGRRLSGYSKGMRQKVGVAIALAKGAQLLVLDEPTSGLDPKAAFEFAELIREVGTQGTGVIMATHDLFRAKDMGDRVIILKDGKAVRELDPKAMSYDEVESAYLGVFGEPV